MVWLNTAINHLPLGMVNIAPIKMEMTGGRTSDSDKTMDLGIAYFQTKPHHCPTYQRINLSLIVFFWMIGTPMTWDMYLYVAFHGLI